MYLKFEGQFQLIQGGFRSPKKSQIIQIRPGTSSDRKMTVNGLGRFVQKYYDKMTATTPLFKNTVSVV